MSFPVLICRYIFLFRVAARAIHFPTMGPFSTLQDQLCAMSAMQVYFTDEAKNNTATCHDTVQLDAHNCRLFAIAFNYILLN